MIKQSDIWISVLLCTYNDELYIKESIESVLNQTYPYFEFIIIDDGSTDKTNSIIKQFSDSRIRLVEKSNTGLTDSLNLGFSLCKYDWVARMDGDDICYPKRLEKQIQYINENVAAIGGQCTLIDCYGKKTCVGRNLPLNHKKILRKTINGHTAIIHPTAIINKKLFNMVGGYDKYIYAAEDLDLWLMLSNYGKLVNLPDELIFYRMHNFNISKIKRKDQFLNAQIARLKYFKGIHTGLTLLEYNSMKKRIENNLVFKFSLNMSIRGLEKKRIILRMYNFIVLFFSRIMKYTIN